jgi:phospholipase C
VPPIFPCFDHPTLANLLDPNHITWRYYSTLTPASGNGLWTAPNSIKDICDAGSVGTNCGGPEWDEHVVLNSQNILADLEPPIGSNPGCDLQAVSWVIPYGDRSDHPGLKENQASTDIEHGPAWVADVINEVGTTTCNDNGVPYWQDTAIFVTWDDFGGFWDHINPDKSANGPGVLYNATGHPCSGFGCGYIYGFRVPLLVVSAYTPAGYVSGACQSPGNCQNEKAPYLHDFGSILAFIENNFLGQNLIGQINPHYRFADAFAPEWTANPPTIPLADFFTLTLPRAFQPIVLPSAWQGYDANYFLNYNGPIMDPDNDAIDND